MLDEQPTKFRCAAFWKRFVAFFFDLIIVAVFYSAALYIINLLFALPVRHIFGYPFAVSLDTERPVAIGMLYVVVFVGVVYPYFAVMESSRWQATLGKKLVGNKVTDLAGNRITLFQSTGRLCGRALSGMILDLGYWMALFTERKQTLHDLLAGTIVLDENKG